MYLGLYTDSVSELALDDVLQLAADLELSGLELAVGGQSSAPHLNARRLLDDPAALSGYQRRIADAGLHVAAINCSAWPFHPQRGKEELDVIRTGIELAGRMGVDTIVTMSGTPGDGTDATFVNWTFYPWPPEAGMLRARQWETILRAWEDLAAFSAAHAVERIAMELHPMHLVYNVPTLLRLRDELGPMFGANLDPSHLFWQMADPIAAARALGDAVHHVHLKDVALNESVVAVSGVLDASPFEDPQRRPWSFVTVGRGHDVGFWGGFIDALAEVGYDGVLSIENEDVEEPQDVGVRRAAEFMYGVLQGNDPGCSTVR